MNESLSTNIKTESDDVKSVYKKKKPSLPLYSTRFKDNFNSYLDGNLTSVQLLQTTNYPYLLAQMADSGLAPHPKSLSLLGDVFKFRSKLKRAANNNKAEERRQYLRGKLMGLNSLIQTRVMLKKADNDERRRMSLQNVTLLKTILDASEGILSRKQDEGQLYSARKNLKTITVSYENNNQRRTKNLNKPEKVFMKTELQESSRKFLNRLQAQQARKQQELDRITRLQLEKKSNFSLYNKDVMTYKDVELFDYLYHKPTQIQYQCQSLEDDDEELGGRKPIKRLNKQTLLRAQHQPENSLDVSHTSSLQSTYEIQLDTLYSQTIDIQKQLKRRQQTLPKKIKSIIRLDELNQTSLKTNQQKLLFQ